MIRRLRRRARGRAERRDRQPRERLGGRVDRFLLMIFGPADLGDQSTPAPVPADVSCPACGGPMREHTFLTAAENRRRVRCPSPPVG